MGYRTKIEVLQKWKTMNPTGTDKYLLTPGPLTTSLATKRAMLSDWGSRDSNFIAITRRIRDRLLTIAGVESSHVAVPYHDYTTAKAALIGYSRNLAMELGPLGIRVNTVAPGLVYATDASRSTKEGMKTSLFRKRH